MTGIAEEAWALLVGVLMAQRTAWLAAGQAEGLTPPQAKSLMALRPDEPPSLGELARHLHCDASYATALADHLEERGFVERRVSAADRRVKELVPTAAGLEAQARLRAAFAAPPPGLLSLSEEDQQALHRIAVTLAAQADPEAGVPFGMVMRPAGGPAPG